MAEGRPPSSSEQPAKPKSSQKGKRPHHTSEPEGKPEERPPLHFTGLGPKPHWKRYLDPDLDKPKVAKEYPVFVLKDPPKQQKGKRASEAKGKEVKTPAPQLSEAQQKPPAAALRTSSGSKPYWERYMGLNLDISKLKASEVPKKSGSPSSSGEPAKPKSSQSEKRPHRISETEAKEVETPALQLSEAQQEPPAAALQTTSSEDKAYREQHLDTVRPESRVSTISTSVHQQESDQPESQSSRSPSSPTLTYQIWNEATIDIYRSDCSVIVATAYRAKPSPEITPAASPGKPPLHTDRAKSAPAFMHSDKADNKAKGAGVVKQRPKSVSIPSVLSAREAAIKLYETQTFFQIKQLTRPIPGVSC